MTLGHHQRIIISNIKHSPAFWLASTLSIRLYMSSVNFDLVHCLVLANIRCGEKASVSVWHLLVDRLPQPLSTTTPNQFWEVLAPQVTGSLVNPSLIAVVMF